jgi:hypothetical protein
VTACNTSNNPAPHFGVRAPAEEEVMRNSRDIILCILLDEQQSL